MLVALTKRGISKYDDSFKKIAKWYLSAKFEEIEEFRA
jgi:hypothetical protein